VRQTSEREKPERLKSERESKKERKAREENKGRKRVSKAREKIWRVKRE